MNLLFFLKKIAYSDKIQTVKYLLKGIYLVQYDDFNK